MPLVAGRPLMFGLLATIVLAPGIHDLLTRSRWSRLTFGLAAHAHARARSRLSQQEHGG